MVFVHSLFSDAWILTLNEIWAWYRLHLDLNLGLLNVEGLSSRCLRVTQALRDIGIHRRRMPWCHERASKSKVLQVCGILNRCQYIIQLILCAHNHFQICFDYTWGLGSKWFQLMFQRLKLNWVKQHDVSCCLVKETITILTAIEAIILHSLIWNRPWYRSKLCRSDEWWTGSYTALFFYNRIFLDSDSWGLHTLNPADFTILHDISVKPRVNAKLDFLLIIFIIDNQGVILLRVFEVVERFVVNLLSLVKDRLWKCGSLH